MFTVFFWQLGVWVVAGEWTLLHALESCHLFLQGTVSFTGNWLHSVYSCKLHFWEWLAIPFWVRANVEVVSKVTSYFWHGNGMCYSCVETGKFVILNIQTKWVLEYVCLKHIIMHCYMTKCYLGVQYLLNFEKNTLRHKIDVKCWVV